MKDATGSFTGGLYGLALFGFAAAVITAFFLDIPPVVRGSAAGSGSPEPDGAEQTAQRA
jgi:ACS family tartrate transporter-like MFS transporter